MVKMDTNVERKERTKDKILDLLTTPKTYTELKETLSVSDPVIQNHLRDLREYGLIRKNSDGLYEITEKGRNTRWTLKAEDISRSVSQIDSQIDQLLSPEGRSKLDPTVRNTLLAYGFFLAIERISGKATSKTSIEIHSKAKTRVEELRKSLASYAPEYTQPYERMFEKMPAGIQGATMMLGLTEPFKSVNHKDLIDASKLMRQLHTELWKSRLKGLVGLKG